MTQTFTQNDLVRHLYTEESKQEADNLNSCLALDEELRKLQRLSVYHRSANLINDVTYCRHDKLYHGILTNYRVKR